MPMPNRTNAATASSSTDTDTDPFDRVTEGDTTYLVAPVVAQEEGVYAYRINGEVQREFLPGEELTAPLDEWDDRPLLLRHPDAPPDTQALLSEPGVEGATVGAFREPRRTNGDERLAGKVYIDEAELGEHNGDLEDYVERVRRRGVGEVSTGYDVGDLEHSPGRHNGSGYEFVQRNIRPDHLALLPDQVGNCPADGGVCGVGRANQDARTNHHPPGGADAETESDAFFARLGRRVADLFGLGDGEIPTGAGGDVSDVTGGAESPADSGTDADGTTDADDSQPTMSDDNDTEQIDALVSDHGFDRENMEALEGSECLSRIHELAAGADESGGAGESGTETPETETSGGGGDGEGTTDSETETETDGGTQPDDPLEDVDIDALIAERVDERLEAALDEQAGDLAEKVDEARQNEQHIQTVAESEDYPLDRDALEGMPPDAVAQLAETVDEPAGDGRANYAGLASGPSFEAGDASPDSELDDIPAPGVVPETGGDD